MGLVIIWNSVTWIHILASSSVVLLQWHGAALVPYVTVDTVDRLRSKCKYWFSVTVPVDCNSSYIQVLRQNNMQTILSVIACDFFLPIWIQLFFHKNAFINTDEAETVTWLQLNKPVPKRSVRLIKKTKWIASKLGATHGPQESLSVFKSHNFTMTRLRF